MEAATEGLLSSLLFAGLVAGDAVSTALVLLVEDIMNDALIFDVLVLVDFLLIFEIWKILMYKQFGGFFVRIFQFFLKF